MPKRPVKKVQESKPVLGVIECTCPASSPVTVAGIILCAVCGNKAKAAPVPAAKPAGKLNLGAALNSQQSFGNKEPAYTPPHLIVYALAGCGKTTSVVTALEYLRGLKPTIAPSPQQKAIWEAVALQRKSWNKFVCFAAFNVAIVGEIKPRVPPGVDVKTMHRLGFGAVCKAFNLGENCVDEDRVFTLTAQVLGDPRVVRKTKPLLFPAVSKLVGLSKMNLVHPPEGDLDPDNVTEEWNEYFAKLNDMAKHYEVDMEGCEVETLTTVPRVMVKCLEVDVDGKVDFNDMVWLPVVLNLPVFKYDLLFVDEAQDLNRCQHELVKRAGRRLVLVGDPNQAIYGFAGADTESMDRLEKELAATPVGCQRLPLTVTRRCGKAIVEQAKAYVPEFEAHPTNKPGVIKRMKYPIQPGREWGETVTIETKDTYVPHVAPGDHVLSRTVAPIINQYFMFLKLGVKAAILGRDIGDGIVKLIDKLMTGCPASQGVATSLDWLKEALSNWYQAEDAKERENKFPSESKLQALRNKFDALVEFSAESASVTQLKDTVRQAFTIPEGVPYVRMSTTHKAKGLEAKRVWFLQPTVQPVRQADKMPEWQIQQERNLRYVAITRAIEELTYVT